MPVTQVVPPTLLDFHVPPASFGGKGGLLPKANVCLKSEMRSSGVVFRHFRQGS